MFTNVGDDQFVDPGPVKIDKLRRCCSNVVVSTRVYNVAMQQAGERDSLGFPRRCEKCADVGKRACRR
jgi:hypothetical protein